MLTKNTFTPTQEQEEILKAFKGTRVLKINAVAGSGKSSTLKLLAEDNKEPSLYVCFNKSIAQEAQEKFPEHVECRTTHSLAYAEYGKILLHKLQRPVGAYKNVAGTPSEIALYYKIKEYPCDAESIQPNAIASLVKQVVNRYQNSAEDTITKVLLPYADIAILKKEHPVLDTQDFGTVILRYAKKLWNDRSDPSSPVLATHDTYLKLWQLSKPVLNYSIIYLDEGQDSNPTVLDIIKRQTQSKICIVGDTFQSIYAFRQAINAMEMIDAPSKVLSKSFRYGQDIADIGTFIIENRIAIKGNENINSKVETVRSKQYTMIFRTNSALLEEAVQLLKKGKDVFCDADTKGFVKKLQSAEALYKFDFKNVKHEDIAPYSTWNELGIAADDDPELHRVQKVIESGKARAFIKSLQEVSTRNKADIILTTAHKSKGQEWDNVIIAGDFPIKLILDPKEETTFWEQERNLFYVACTRAINSLELPQAFLNEYNLYLEELEDGEL